MGNAIVAAFCVAIMLVASLMLNRASLTSADLIAQSWKQTEQRMGDITRTSIDAYQSSTASSYVEIMLRNDGHVSLADFGSWDVIVQYTGDDNNYRIVWLPYIATNPPGNNQWTVKGIYFSESPSDQEVFEPGIFNEKEYMVIKMRLSPMPKVNVTNWAIISTPNGVTTSVMFQR